MLKLRVAFLALAVALPLVWGKASPADDLVSYWPLDGGLDDKAVAGNSDDNGKFVGEASFGKGRFGEGIVLDGSNYVSIANSSDLNAANKSISVSAWFRVDDWPERWETLLAKGRGNRFSISHQSLDPDRLAWFGGVESDMGEVGGGSVNDGRWHHVVGVTVAHARAMLFIDGELVKTRGPDSARLGNSDSPLLLGDNPEPSRENRRWIGAIDDVGLFTIALNPAEARAIYALASDKAFEYDLGKVAQLIDLHRRRHHRIARIGDIAWKYAPADPGDGRPFVALAESGSGVAATPRPSVAYLETSRRFIKSGDTVELRWRVSEDAQRIHIDPHPGDVSRHSGVVAVAPRETTEFTIKVKNEYGESEAVSTIHVDYQFATPRISEFMANNKSEHLDEDGERADWIELTNPAPRVASTDNLFLTDSIDNMTMWPVPEMLLEPGESVVVFASGKDRVESQLHANFKLAAEGEYLALVRSDGQTTEVVSSFGERYPKQKAGRSYGVGAGGEVGPLAEPTPNAANSHVVADDVKKVRFGTERALAQDPFELTLDCETEEAVIYFTTDGSLPAPDKGVRYDQPISIETTTVVRARAFQAGMRPSRVTTHTYLFPEHVLKQPAKPAGFPETWESLPADYAMDQTITEDPAYRADLLKGITALPSMSISMPNEDLFGANGVYSNPLDGGRAWERATSLEYIRPDGVAGFQIDCGLRIQGGFSRNRKFRKHGLRVLFKDVYGPTKLKYPLFEDPDAATSFDTLILRAGFNNSWQAGSSRAQHLRDEFIRRSLLEMGQPSSRGSFVHLYLNGLYWGVYNVVERPSGTFAASYLGGKRDEYDALNSGQAVDGTTESWRRMQDLARSSRPNNVVESLSKFVNLDNLIDYMLVNFYGGNDDWDGHNWYAARRRTPGAGYHFFAWDSERTLENVEGSDKTKTNRRNNPSYVFNQLLRNSSFRQRVMARVQLHFTDGGALTPAATTARYTKLANLIEDAMVAESARWGDAQPENRLTRDDNWIPERDRLLQSWFPRRTDVVLDQLNRAGNLGYIKPPVLNRVGESIVVPATAGVVYITTDGSDPRLDDGTPNPTARVVMGFSIQEAFLKSGSEWKFLDDGSDQGQAWRAKDFDDSAWKMGVARLGYGDDGEATKISFGPDPEMKFMTAYFRRTFSAPADKSFDLARLLLSRDDGAVVYLDGEEIVRSNMPGGEINFQTQAASTHDDHKFLPFDLPAELFTAGEHTVAVEVHQGTPASSDTGFDLRIQGVKENRTEIPLSSFDVLKARTFLNETWSPLSIHSAVASKQE